MFSNKKISPLLYGSVLEYYDFSIYSFLVPILAQKFFPHESYAVSILYTFAVFAGGFIARPLGGIVFGYIGDRISRKKALLLSLLLMGGATTLIGLLPTYEQVGFLSPLMLIVCRLVQSLCIGGEYCGCIILALEQTPFKKQNYIASLITAAGVLGWFIGSGISSLTHMLKLPFESWRLPFLLGALIAVVGYYIRRNVLESPEMQHIIKSKTINTNLFKSFLYNKYKVVIAIAGIAGLNGCLFYSFLIFPNTYLSFNSSIDTSTISFCTTFGIAAYMILLPLMGKIADKFGSIKIMLISAFLVIPTAIPFYLLLRSGNIAYILLTMILSSTIMAALMVTSITLITHLFQPSVRYTGVSFSYNLGSCLLGGSTSFFSMYLLKSTGLSLSPSFYVILCGVIGTISALYISKNIIDNKPLN